MINPFQTPAASARQARGHSTPTDWRIVGRQSGRAATILAGTVKTIQYFILLAILMFSTGAARAQYAGTYAGTYTGDESGTWIFTVDDSSTSLSGYANNTVYGEGSVDAIGGVVIGFVGIGASFVGQIDAAGRVTGTWKNPSYYNYSGTFSGNRMNPTITTSSPLPAGTVGTPYNRTLAASGGTTPYTWSIVSGSLPSGLILSSGGVISGTSGEVTTADFTVQVTGKNGYFSTKDFSLAFLLETIKPTLTITTPATGQQVKTNTGQWLVKGTASDNVGVVEVRVNLNNTGWQPAAGTTAWQTWMDLQPGSNTVAAYALDAAGNQSPTKSVGFTYVVTAPLNLNIIGLGKITGATNGQMFEIGKSVTLAAAPGAGYKLTNWLVTVDDTTVLDTNKTVPFLMQSNLLLTATFVDVTKPTNTIISPLASTSPLTNGLVTVNVRATDNVEVANVEFFFNGQDFGSGFYWGTNLWTMDFALAIGTNIVQTVAIDAAGNRSTTNSILLVYVNRQTNANTITYSEKLWGIYTPGPPGIGIGWVQDTSLVNAALKVPGLSALPDEVWSTLHLKLTFGDYFVFDKYMSDAESLTTNQATFDFSEMFWDPAYVAQVTFTRAGDVLRVALHMVNPTYLSAAGLYPDIYPWGMGSTVVQPSFALLVDDGSESNIYADVTQTIFINAASTSTYDNQGHYYVETLRFSGAADFTAPTNTITSPTSGQRWSNTVFTVKGVASDNVQVSNVWLQLNGGEWTNATTANGWTNWSAALNLIPGTNTVAAFAVDTAGNVSITNSQNFQFVVTNVLGVKADGLGAISPNYSNAWLEIGRNYSITSSPASGFVATNWVVSTNWLGGMTTNNAVVRFMMASNLTLQINFADVAKPTNTITAPTAGQKMTNALATIVGTAKDNWKVTGVWFQLNNGAWNAPATTNGWTNWTTTLQLTIGTNTVKAYAMDLGGNFSTTNSLSVVSSNTFKLQLGFTDTVPLKTNGLVFSLQLSTGLNGHIQVSTNLTSWTTLTNFIGTNTTLNFRDPAATNYNQRFYRAMVP